MAVVKGPWKKGESDGGGSGYDDLERRVADIEKDVSGIMAALGRIELAVAKLPSRTETWAIIGVLIATILGAMALK